LKKG
jgi:hypothetical protein